MWICIILFAATLTGNRYLKKKGRKISPNIIRIMLCIQCLGMILSFYDGIQIGNSAESVIRNDAGEGESAAQWKVSGNGFEEDIQMEISERRLSEEEARDKISAAEKEIDQTFFGSSENAGHVTDDVVAAESYQDGWVEAAWSFDNSDLVSADGSLHLENLQEETLVQAVVTLYCQEYESRYCFSFLVCPPEADTKAGFIYFVRKALREAEEKSRDEKQFELPQNVEGTALEWEEKTSERGISLAFLGTAAGVALVMGEKEDRRRKEQRIEEEKLRDYPDIISNLSVFLGAGLSIQTSLGRIGEQYLHGMKKKESKKREGFEQILMTYRQMQDGVGEMEALRRLGERNSLREYRKLSLLLQQNLRKGTKELLQILEREEMLSFELRQNLAKRAGEEASTKLLLPMVGFLIIVMAVLLAPAMMNIQI